MQDVSIIIQFSILKWSTEIKDIDNVLHRALIKNILVDERIIIGLGRYVNTIPACEADRLTRALPVNVIDILRGYVIKSLHVKTGTYSNEWEIIIKVVI